MLRTNSLSILLCHFCLGGVRGANWCCLGRENDGFIGSVVIVNGNPELPDPAVTTVLMTI